MKRSASCTFFPSPASMLWAEVPLHLLKSHSEDRARRNFRNIESVLTRDHQLPYPSTLECFLSLETSRQRLGDEELQKASIKWLVACMPKSIARDIFGYACLHGTCRRMLMTQSLGFPEIDRLGAQFESLYPILIGPRASCEGLAAALYGRSEVVPIPDSQTAVLNIGAVDVKAALQDSAVQAWIVTRPEVPDRLGPRVFVTPPKTK